MKVQVYRYHPSNIYIRHSQKPKSIGKYQQIGGNASRRLKERVKCLICSNWYIALGSHLPSKHGIKVKDYCTKFHFLRKDTISSDLIDIQRENGKRLFQSGKVDLYKNTHSEKAIKARKKFWKEQGRKEYSTRMKWLARKRWNSMTFKERQKFLEKTYEHKKKEFDELKKWRANCLSCGKEIKITTFIRDGKIRHRRKRKYCNNCWRQALKGRPLTEEHKKNISISKTRAIKNGQIVFNRIRTPIECQVCKKIVYVYPYLAKIKKTCGHKCAGILAGKKITELSKNKEWAEKKAKAFLKYRKGEYRTCKKCGKSFYLSPSFIKKHGYFCSVLCWQKFHTITKKCIKCEKEFNVRKSENNKLQKCINCRN